MPTFRSECILNASAEALFEFHNNPANLMKVMPPTSRLVELRADESAVEGGVIELRMRELGIVPMRWKCRWKRVEPPHLLVDEMVEGPFQSFVHHHRFESMDKMRTRMVDEIYYTMRGGWLGHLFSITFFRIYLTMMFAWRKRRMRQLFNEG
ncbi:SRPBCC family protein [Roseimicrobium sp. ORNL1]|uniref:SRPBCC family protein n=1 Tax=Roseimicrobium sp. ORNL1 TaxID=2711231 RepID=UPI0013E0F9E2|nr:SRPBCC family protein [Roseimicrobium sp. ORNL1]QIF03705.1 SRPBCC family protein [Roseimicrobium sp. ORNL1]